MEKIPESRSTLPKIENGEQVFVINQEGHEDDFSTWLLLEETVENGKRLRKMQQVSEDGTLNDRIETFSPDEVTMVSDKFFAV